VRHAVLLQRTDEMHHLPHRARCSSG
jgi:hypothetical protein